MNFKSNNDKFILGLGLFSILVLLFILLIDNENLSITAQDDKNYESNKNEKDNAAVADLTTIKTKINLNNINIKNHERLKLVAYLNGEGQTTYIDLKESKDKSKRQFFDC